ncbi:MAG TPA: N-acetylneuraminate synthase family protein [Rhizomicrobium sp.]|jgi:N-acetylneuraminate synthase|nr:N-acetylneuraminate synthase family protein [Rhizomicrobium sp.]
MVKFIAEVSSNHAQDLGRSLAFVDAAAACGFDAVKFQLFRVAELFAPEILVKSPQHSKRVAWELPLAHLEPIANRCHEKNIEFSCTPFYLEAVKQLEPYVAFYKVASYELLWTDLLKACAATGKPVIISTGMAIMPEIRAAVATLEQARATDITVLHCVSAYPSPPEQSNLSAIQAIRVATGAKTGWSDHSRSPAVIERAVHHWNATTIELHLDLDGTGEEYHTGHCWLPDEIAPVIARVRLGLTSDGNGFKEPVPAELPDREWRADPSDGLRPFKHVRKTWVPA